MTCVQVTECAAASGRALRWISPSSGPPPAAIKEKAAASPGCHKNRKPPPHSHTHTLTLTLSAGLTCSVLILAGDELIEEILLVRGERKQLEWTRQELLRKGKDLLSQNRHRRNQGRWQVWNYSASFYLKLFHPCENSGFNRQFQKCFHST